MLRYLYVELYSFDKTVLAIQRNNHIQNFKKWNACVLIPTYNNAQFLAAVLTEVLVYTNDLIVVNDGSTDETEDVLKEFETQASVIHLPKNEGKGIALYRGFQEAQKMGFDYVLTMDSDSQHRASDIPNFFEKLKNHPNHLLLGTRNFNQKNMPSKNGFANKFANFWYQVMTGLSLPDTQTGYRIYPLKPLMELNFYTTKYEFEMEALVRLTWRDVLPVQVPIDVYYPPQEVRVTHFRPSVDFMRIFVLNTVLVAIGLLWERPKKIFRDLKKKSFKEAWRTYILDSEESNGKIAASVSLGIFLGIAPFWGAQIILIIFFAKLLRLNTAIALVAGHISIPPMIPLIFIGSYWLGGQLLDNPVMLSLEKIQTILAGSDGVWASIHLLFADVWQYGVGAFGLGVIGAFIFGVVSYFLLLIFRGRT